MPRVRPLLVALVMCSVLVPARAWSAEGVAIALSPRVGPPTTVTTVRGTGFSPGERVIVDLDTFPAASARADGGGSLRARVVVPGSALPGEHPVSATGQLSGSTAEA